MLQHNAGHMQQDTGYSILQAICYALLLQLIRWVRHIILTIWGRLINKNVMAVFVEKSINRLKTILTIIN